VDLTAIEPAVAGNPNLVIRFQVQSTQNRVGLDDIRVLGTVRCDAAPLGIVNLGSAAENPPGQYSVDLTCLRGKPTRGVLECSWTGTDPPRTASDTFLFQ
jgi:hypothetical protein